jgi:hypothetical protein
MRLIDTRIKSIQSQRKIDRIDVVQKAASKGPAGQRGDGYEKG